MAQANHFKVTFKPSGRGPAQCPTDKAYPDGVKMDLSVEGAPSCTVWLPYPAPECGYINVQCERCGFRVAVTAAGRADDPRVLIVPCRLRPEVH